MFRRKNLDTESTAQAIKRAIILGELARVEALLIAEPHLRDKPLGDLATEVLSCSAESHSPLTYAIAHGRYGIVAMLCRIGVNPDYPDAHGRIPVNMAVDRGHEKMIRILSAFGANFDRQDVNGQTARDCAEKHSFRGTLVPLLNSLELRRIHAQLDLEGLELPKRGKAVTV